MAVKIRLKRMGKRKQPSYRVVVADSRAPRDGRIIELLGRYDPRQDPSLIEIDNERAQYWLSTGAQPTDRVKKLLEISGAVGRAKVSRSGVYRLDHDEPAEEPAEVVVETPAEAQPAGPAENVSEDASESQTEDAPEDVAEVSAEEADAPPATSEDAPEEKPAVEQSV